MSDTVLNPLAWLHEPADPWAEAGPFHPMPELPAGYVADAAPLLRAIFAEPDDWTVKGAFADWLEERGICANRVELIRLGWHIECERLRLIGGNVPHSHPDWTALVDAAERERNLIKTGEAFGRWWHSPWKGWQLETRSWVVVIGGASYPRCVVRCGFISEVNGPLACLLDEGGFADTIESPADIAHHSRRHILTGYMPTERGTGSEFMDSSTKLAGAIGLTWPVSAVVPREVNRAIEQVDHRAFMVMVGPEAVPGVWMGSPQSHVVPPAVAVRLRGERTLPDPVGVRYSSEAEAVYDIARAWAEVFRSRRNFPTRAAFLASLMVPGEVIEPHDLEAWMDEVDNQRPYTGNWSGGEDDELVDYDPTGHGDDDDEFDHLDDPEDGEGDPADWLYEPHPADNL